MAILITGIAGFIGFHLAKKLEDSGETVVGIDNFNDYYDISLKRDRVKKLKSKIYEGSIEDEILLDKIIKENSISEIYHMAAQAGVRYSLENPRSYEFSNNLGTINIFELAKNNNINKIIYASSSSVYGGNKKIPFSIKDNVSNPVSVYAATKIYNELLAKTYFNLYGLKSIGLRFFTVYGSWGRPDMSYFKFMNLYRNGESIDVYNGGDHERDFTHISDVVDGIIKAMKSDISTGIYNLGNNNTVKLMDFISELEKIFEINFEKKYIDMQPGDVHKTNADISETIRDLEWLPKTNIGEGLKEFADWYKEYYK